MDRDLFWKVSIVNRIDVPHKVSAYLRLFYDGVRVRVRTDDGECSGRFKVKQGVRQGCVLSLSLLNVLFAAALHIVSFRFIQVEGIMAILVQLDEDGVNRETERMDRAQNTVYGMLDADYAGVVS